MEFCKQLKFLILIVIASLQFVPITAQTYLDLSQKDVFNLGFPAYFKFRGEMFSPDHVNYDAWVSSLAGTTGVMQKFVDEELVIKPSTTVMQSWVNQYATEQPQKLLLLHWNGRARQVENREYVHNLYFPGHWIYEVGSIVNKNCLPTDTIIRVSSTAPYSLQAYKDFTSSPTVYYPSYILLVKLDASGNKLWEQSEVVRVKKIDNINNLLTIDRGLIYTTPLSFDANKTYAAPFDCSIINSQCMRYYNMSSDCPKDSNGKMARDVLVSELKSYFSPNGILKNLNGIAFDVNYFDCSDNTNWDVNNDGVADAGWVNGQNSWLKGNYAFFKELRDSLGSNYILTCDGEFPNNQKAVGVLNGIESEGLVQPNDGWRGISRTINTHLYWQSNTTVSNPFRYVVLKLQNSTDATNSDRLNRFATATACSLGAFVANTPDLTSFPTWMSQPNALGNTSGDLIRYAKYSPNLQNLSNTDLVGKMSSTDSNIALSNGDILISTKAGYPANQNMTITLSNISMQAGDVTIFIEAQSIDPLEGMTLSDRVPRLFNCTLSNLPDYGEGKTTNAFYSDIYGFFGTAKVEEMSFYYRRDGVAAGNQSLTFSVQGRGKFVIKTIKIYNQADILIRQFDKGIVIVNPSLDNKMVNLSTVFPTQNLANGQITVPAVDAYFYQKNLTTYVNPEISSLVSRISTNVYRLNDNDSGDYSIRLFDVSGRLILNKTLTNKEFSLPSKGVYLLEVFNKNRRVGKEKLIY